MECVLFGMWFNRNVPFLDCALFGMWPKWNVLFWNVLFLEYPLFGMCFQLNVTKNGMWQKMEWDKNGLSGWLRQSWSSMWYLLNIKLSKLFDHSLSKTFNFSCFQSPWKRLSMPLLGTVLFIYFCGEGAFTYDVRFLGR